MDKFWSTVSEILLAVVGLAALAVLVSKNSQTSTVATSLFGGFGSILSVAEAPVTGSGGQLPGSGFHG